MIRIAITQAAFDAIVATMQLGLVAVEPELDAKGERLISLDLTVLNRLRALRWPSESHSDVILRLAVEGACAPWLGWQSRSPGPSSIPSLGDGVMLGAAWIDRPVDTQGLRFLLPRPPQRPHGSTAMLKPMIGIPLASLRRVPEALPGRPETAETVAAA